MIVTCFSRTWAPENVNQSESYEIRCGEDSFLPGNGKVLQPPGQSSGSEHVVKGSVRSLWLCSICIRGLQNLWMWLGREYLLLLDVHLLFQLCILIGHGFQGPSSRVRSNMAHAMAQMTKFDCCHYRS